MLLRDRASGMGQGGKARARPLGLLGLDTEEEFAFLKDRTCDLEEALRVARARMAEIDQDRKVE